MCPSMPRQQQPFSRLEVRAAFDSWPAGPRKRMLQLRELIFATAAATPGVGAIEEDLRWGQPSYLTTETKSGTAVRLGFIPADDAGSSAACGVYVHCQTNIVAAMRRKLNARGTNATPLAFDGNRCLRVPLSGRLPAAELREFFVAALTYRLRGIAEKKTATANNRRGREVPGRR